MENQALIIALTLVSLVCGIALFVNWSANRHIPGLVHIATGFMITSIGILLLTTQEQWSPLVSIILANGLILGGRIPLLVGLARFWNQEQTKLPLITSVFYVATMIGFYYFTFPAEDTMWRIRIYTVMMTIFNLSYIFTISKGMKIERILRPATAAGTNYGAYLALMLFSFNAITETILMFIRSGNALQATNEGTFILLLGSIFTMIVFSFAIIIMTMEELNVEYQENAIFDPITTILNHRTFLEVGQRVMGIALRYSKPVSLLTIEINNMDQVVKEYGYKIGNEMLRHFSLMATDRRRNEDVLARSSFKEFRMLLPGVDEQGCKVVIDKINKALLAEEYIYRGKSINVDVTISAVTKREEDLNLQQMLQEGEIELYRVKLASA